jgi:hypothetical protein
MGAFVLPVSIVKPVSGRAWHLLLLFLKDLEGMCCGRHAATHIVCHKHHGGVGHSAPQYSVVHVMQTAFLV